MVEYTEIKLYTVLLIDHQFCTVRWGNDDQGIMDHPGPCCKRLTEVQLHFAFCILPDGILVLVAYMALVRMFPLVFIFCRSELVMSPECTP